MSNGTGGQRLKEGVKRSIYRIFYLPIGEMSPILLVEGDRQERIRKTPTTITVDADQGVVKPSFLA